MRASRSVAQPSAYAGRGALGRPPSVGQLAMTGRPARYATPLIAVAAFVAAPVCAEINAMSSLHIQGIVSGIPAIVPTTDDLFVTSRKVTR